MCDFCTIFYFTLFPVYYTDHVTNTVHDKIKEILHTTWNVGMSVHITFHAYSDHMINTTYIKG